MGKRSHKLVVISSSDEEEDVVKRRHTTDVRAHRSEPTRHSGHEKDKTVNGFSLSGINIEAERPLATQDCLGHLSETFSKVGSFQQRESRNEILRAATKEDGELWVAKYKPQTLGDLAVHRKKIAEVKTWLEQKFNESQLQTGSNVLLITGPTGAGKTATVYVLTKVLGIEIFEWDTPTPTLWREYLHQVNSGLSYRSKLDEFETFLGTVQKYPLLQSSSNSISSRNRMLLVIDDMPVINNKDVCQRLCQHLHNLALFAQFPIVITLTQYTEARDNESSNRSIQELEMALEEGGATKITFNPFTVRTITTTLSKIWKREYCCSPPRWLDSISEGSGGDMRNAINSLQFFCLSEASGGSSQQSLERFHLPKSKSKRSLANNVSQLPLLSFSSPSTVPNIQLNIGRDGMLSLFHCLGKVLHNKREKEIFEDSGKDIVLKENLERYPLQMGVPEEVLSQAHAEAGSFAAFLHENLLDFIDDEAIEDAWMAINYLSDSDCLLGGGNTRHMRRHHSLDEQDTIDKAQIVELFAGSVMTRGVLFANCHPAPTRWQSIRGPRLWQVERSSLGKKVELSSNQWIHGSIGRNCSLSNFATECRPLEFLFAKSTQLLESRTCRDVHEGLHSFIEEDVTADMDSIDLDEYFPQADILPRTNNVTRLYCSGNSNERADETVEDEIEEW